MKGKELLPLQLECTMLFQTNPYMIESIDGIGIRLGRTKEELLPIMELLLKQGMIEKLGDESTPRYRYLEPAIINQLNETGDLKKA